MNKNRSKGSTPEPQADATYWMTRNARADGALADKVDVWTSRPERKRLPSGEVVWLGLGPIGLEDHHCMWTPGEAFYWARVYPETSLECIRVGNEPEAAAS